MRVRYQRAARAAYNHHLARHVDDPAALVQLQERFDAAEKLLGSFPHLGRAGRVPNTRELVLARPPYVFVDRIEEKAVMVLDIRHSAREPS